MANQKQLIELQLAAFQRAHILATDAKVKFKLEHDIAEAEERLAALLGKEPPASPSQRQRVPTNTNPKTSVPWWQITVVATVITFLLGWWMCSPAPS